MSLNNFEKNSDYPPFVEEKAQKLLNIINNSQNISPQIEYFIEDYIALSEGTIANYYNKFYLEQLKENEYKEWSTLDFKLLLEYLSFQSPFFKKLIEKIRSTNNQ
jgi:hypothetical protein